MIGNLLSNAVKFTLAGNVEIRSVVAESPVVSRSNVKRVCFDRSARNPLMPRDHEADWS